MQPPTAQNLRIRTVQDAHVIFHAVSLGILPMVTRRLDTEERRAVRAGNVYVWEERGRHTEATGLGIERWTDGIRWSASRVRDEFLLYHERESGIDIDFSDPEGYLPDGSPNTQLADYRASIRLVKQTYSVFVDLPQGRRKWHLTAYFIPASVDNLRNVSDIPQLAALRVPEGMYTSAKLNSKSITKGQGEGRALREYGGTVSVHGYPPAGSASPSSPYSPYAPYPNLQVQGPGQHLPPPHPSSPHSLTPPAWAGHPSPSPLLQDQSPHNQSRVLPGLPSLGLSPVPPVQSPYSPRHPVDDEQLRILNRSI